MSLNKLKFLFFRKKSYLLRHFTWGLLWDTLYVDLFIKTQNLFEKKKNETCSSKNTAK